MFKCPTVERRSFERRSLELLNSVALEKSPTVQRLKCSKVQKSKSPKVEPRSLELLNSAALERRSLELLNSVALEKSPTVQMLKCSTVQKFNS